MVVLLPRWTLSEADDAKLSMCALKLSLVDMAIVRPTFVLLKTCKQIHKWLLSITPKKTQLDRLH